MARHHGTRFVTRGLSKRSLISPRILHSISRKAEVLRATATAASSDKWIFIGLALGAAIKLGLVAFVLLPSELSMNLPVLPKVEFALEIAPALRAVGYLLGYNQSAIMVSG